MTKQRKTPSFSSCIKFLFRSRCNIESPRPVKISLAATLAVLAIGLCLTWTSINAQNLSMPNDGHAIVSFRLAVTRAFCGKISHLDPAPSGQTIQGALMDKPEAVDTPVTTLLQNIYSSPEEHCLKASAPVLNNENSVMLLESLLLYLAPNMTTRDLAIALNGVKILCLGIFVFALFNSGAPFVFSLLCFIVAGTILSKVNDTHPFSLYPFLLPLTLALCSILSLPLNAKGFKGHLACLATALGVGFFSAFFVNLRSSYLPVVVVVFAIYTVYILSMRLFPNLGKTASKLATLGVIICFVFGYGLFQQAYIAPLSQVDHGNNRTYHVIGHPLVLSLALPENGLSKREGITWNDSIGTELARKTDPTAVYLGKNYEKAMLTYYLKLWIYYPNEMVNIYYQKLKISAHHALFYVDSVLLGSSNTIDKMVGAIYLPAIFTVPSGIYYGLGFLFIALLTFAFSKQLRNSSSFLLISLSTTASLLYLEAALIMPYFVHTYHAYLLFAMGLCVLLITQLIGDQIIDLLFWALKRFKTSPPKKNGAEPVN